MSCSIAGIVGTSSHKWWCASIFEGTRNRRTQTRRVPPASALPAALGADNHHLELVTLRGYEGSAKLPPTQKPDLIYSPPHIMAKSSSRDILLLVYVLWGNPSWSPAVASLIRHPDYFVSELCKRRNDQWFSEAEGSQGESSMKDAPDWSNHVSPCTPQPSSDTNHTHITPSLNLSCRIAMESLE